jgi:hypothetical protein
MKKIFFFTFLMASGFITMFTSCSKTNNTTINTVQAGSLAKFAIANDRLYCINDDKLNIYDVSNASTPVLNNTIPLDGIVETLFPFGNQLYMGTTTGFFRYDITNPDNPSNRQFVQHQTSCDPVVVNDSFAFVTLRGGNQCGALQSRIEVWKIENNTVTQRLATQNLVEPFGLGLSGKYIFVCDGKEGIKSFSYTYMGNKLTNHQTLKLNEASFYDVIPYNNTLICYTSKGLAYVDITNPLSIKILSQVKN